MPLLILHFSELSMKTLYALFVLLIVTSCLSIRNEKSIHEDTLESLIIDTYYLNKGLLYPEMIEVPIRLYNKDNLDSALTIVSVDYLSKKVKTNMDILNDSMKIHVCAQKMAEGKLIVDSLTFVELSKHELKKDDFVDSIYHSGGIKALLHHYANPNNFIFEFTSFEEIDYLIYLFYQHNIIVCSGFDSDDGSYFYLIPFEQIQSRMQ